MSNVVHVDDNNFETEVLQSKEPVLVDFGAVWCGPCQRQLPIIEKFAEVTNLVKVVKVDVDEAPEAASKYGVRSVPTLALFKDGVKVDIKVGLTNLTALETFVREKLGV